MQQTIIKVENLRKVYRLGHEKVVALDRINLDIHEGEICCILGTSGSGKSTLLNMLAGLEKPTAGRVNICGTDISSTSERKMAKFRQNNLGFVFQSYNLLNSQTALENVALPLTFKGVRKKKRNLAAKRMLEAVDLGKRLHHRPSQMSGGQQQRVGIARAFVAHPRVVFADEPTGNLDSKTTIEVMELMCRMAREHKQTLVIVTHDSEIAEYADRVIHLLDGNIVDDRYNQNKKTTYITNNETSEEDSTHENQIKN